MQYMFLIYSEERPDGPPPEEIASIMTGHWAVMQDARQKGILRAVERLKPASVATTVRMQNGKAMTLDGPFAETKEQLAGYYILECKDLDEAIEWAKRIPSNCRGSEGGIEIRPVADIPQLT